MAAVAMTNITQLLQAAEFLERREREHGYASTMPYNPESTRRKLKVKRLHSNSRSSHNELEKNRRAHLRNCLERLKEIVPLTTESARHTTLGLLTNAKDFIASLEREESKYKLHKEKLAREQRFLKRRLEQLRLGRHKIRQDSTGSSSLMSDDSEKDEVDVTGYNSDSDLSSSSEMTGSDGGLAVSTKEIIIVEQTL
ncbi:max dimerization protein 1-like [Acanthaster planci]|uniref:Max dimerization protein 1-like n=1 Tax=Acanthaster planci TaxID=133434 RepID=A0A8B7XL31_ACAPL|nr:max dimerization protein 1-like [Acanthaster planci]